LPYVSIVANVEFQFEFQAGKFAGFKYFVIKLLMYSVVTHRAIINLECLKKLMFLLVDCDMRLLLNFGLLKSCGWSFCLLFFSYKFLL